MGILSKLWREPSLPSMCHPIFGDIAASLEVGQNLYFWETRDARVTEKGDVGIFFDADASGPSNAQVAMWHRIYANFDACLALAKPLLKARLEEYGIGGRIDELCWTALGLAADGSDSSPWDLSFDVDDKIFTVRFEHGQPKSVTCDC